MLPAEADGQLAQQADLRLRDVAGLVDELEDDARADQRDRHRHEDQRLVDRLAPHPVHQQGEHQPEPGGDQRRHQQPQQRVEQHVLDGVAGERPAEVLPADELAAVVVVEAEVDGAHQRCDQSDDQQQDGRAEEHGDGQRAAEPPGGAAGDEEDRQQDPEESRYGADAVAELDARVGPRAVGEQCPGDGHDCSSFLESPGSPVGQGCDGLM